MADRFIHIPNSDTHNFRFFCRLQRLKRLDTQFNNPTIPNLIKVPKVIKSTNKKMLLLNFGDWFNKQPNVLSLPLSQDF